MRATASTVALQVNITGPNQTFYHCTDITWEVGHHRPALLGVTIKQRGRQGARTWGISHISTTVFVAHISPL